MNRSNRSIGAGRAAVGMLASLLAAAGVCAQPTSPPQPTAKDKPAQIETHPEINAGFALGQRVSFIRGQVEIVPVVVIVPDDATSYIEAIARWTPKARFPVLIDDGTRQATEDIARFVRALKPAKVVRWEVGADFKPAEGEPAALPAGIPEHHPKQLAALADRAIARAWGFDKSSAETVAFVGHLKAMNLTPPGIVLCNAEDQAWTAGLALAAGHGQPIAWIKAPQAPGGTMSKAQADALVKSAQEAAKATGLKWEEMGDDIDAVSLCLNVPAKFPFVEGGKGGMASTTDVVGRKPFSEAGEQAPRWAFSSVIFGTRARGAYSAMCSLFLTPAKAWIFDGYGDSGGFKTFDGTEAGKLLTERGKLEVVVDDAPHQDEAAWRARSAKAIDASLVMVNSSGNADFFDLKPGRMKPADIPILGVPAAISMVHSWSAADVSARGTVAGRWFDHGAFAYFGSMEEPFLQAFVPTPFLAARLSSRFAWAAAVRIEGGHIWKLVCFGDPLWTLAPTGPRRELEPDGKFALQGAVDLHAGLRELLKAGKLAEAAQTLVLLGRDEDVTRLVDSTLKDKPALADAEFCAAALPSTFRAGRPDLLIECYARFGENMAPNEYFQDCLWLSCRPGTPGAPKGKRVIEILEKNIRADNKERDGGEVGISRAIIK
ncbi:MAG: hypothetical protein IT435_04585 [Phycisphaerales bacterium]|nr:hypothetical protein [Phycisphaerales bacterium]